MQPAALPAALALAAGSGSAAAGGSGNATGVAAAAGAGPAGGAAPEAAGSAADAARLVASMEREFAAELDQVVQAEDPKAAADAVLQLLPPDVHPVLDASAAAFVEQVCGWGGGGCTWKGVCVWGGGGGGVFGGPGRGPNG